MKTKLVACRQQLVGRKIPNSFGRLQATSYKLPARLRRGFTLIELLVVIAIIVVISALMLANINRFGGQTLLQNLAYDIALSMREAQVYGISVRENNGVFGTGYGMHFDMTHTTSYDLFADTLQNGVYGGLNKDVPPSPYMIGKGFSIDELCVTSGGTEDCSQPTLNIVFVRPEPDAWINASCVRVGDGSESCTSSNTRARIILTSPSGATMSVEVWNNGQISVNSCGTGACSS